MRRVRRRLATGWVAVVVSTGIASLPALRGAAYSRVV